MQNQYLGCIKSVLGMHQRCIEVVLRMLLGVHYTRKSWKFVDFWAASVLGQKLSKKVRTAFCTKNLSFQLEICGFWQHRFWGQKLPKSQHSKDHNQLVLELENFSTAKMVIIIITSRVPLYFLRWRQFPSISRESLFSNNSLLFHAFYNSGWKKV